MSITLTRKIKLFVHVPSTITDEKERSEYKKFCYKLLKNVNQQNFELHNLLVKKLIEIDAIFQGNISTDERYIELRNEYYKDKTNDINRNNYFKYIYNKKDEFIKSLGGKNLQGYIYTYLVEYLKKLPPEEQYINSYTYCSISKNVVDKYTTDQKDVDKGHRTVAFYKNTQPIPINIKAPPKITESGEKVKNLGKEWFNKYDNEYTFKFKSLKKHQMELSLIFGRDKSNNRAIIDRLYNNDPNYKLCDSKIQIVDKDIFLLLTYKQFDVKRNEELDINKVLGVDIGMKCAAYVATNFSEYRQMIGERKFVLMKTKLQIEKDKRLIQKNSKFSRGGHGRQRKLQKLNDYRKYEFNFRSTFNHKMAKEIVDIALSQRTGQINIEDLSSIPLKEKNNRVLRNWSYFDLLSKIEYKAKKHNIIVNKINPAYTSQKCNECGEMGERPKQDTFICKNQNCKSFNKIINADYNAARNMAKFDLTKKSLIEKLVI